MQLGVEGPLGRHQLRDVAHVKNLTLCYKHFIGNYPVIVCQVCFRQKKLCVSRPFRGAQGCAHPAFRSARVYARAQASVGGFLWQSMKCLAGVTWGGRSSLCIQSKTLIVTFSPIKGLKWKPDVEWNLVTMRTVFLQIPLFCSLATVHVQTGCRNRRTIYTHENARTKEKDEGRVSSGQDAGQSNATHPDLANCLLLGT